MDRYSNKAFEKKLDQANEERRINASRFDVHGNRKLYRYSRNLDDSKCFLPPVPGEEKRKRVTFTKYGENSPPEPWNPERNPKVLRQEFWEPTPSNTLRIEQAVPKDWKEERRVRVENAMKRVEQSYVGELRHGADDTSRYVRPDLNERPESRKHAHALIPLQYAGTYPQGDISDVRITDDQLAEAIDLLIPKANDATVRRPEEEVMLDMKRQALLERKIPEANEFQRKQRQNVDQPAKEEPKKTEEKQSPRHFSHLPPPPHEPAMPTTPINGIIVKIPRPVPPIRPTEEDNNSYSKRRRKLKQCAVHANETFVRTPHQPRPPTSTVPATAYGPPAPPPKIYRHETNNVAQDTNHPATYRVAKPAQEETNSVKTRDVSSTSVGMAYFIPNEPHQDCYNLDPQANIPAREPTPKCKPKPKRPEVDDTTTITSWRDSIEYKSQTPIPRRHASYNNWNGETAKRCLGFKSKLRKEMEEASLRALEPKEEEERKPQRSYVSSEVAAKWKREMLRDF